MVGLNLFLHDSPWSNMENELWVKSRAGSKSEGKETVHSECNSLTESCFLTTPVASGGAVRAGYRACPQDAWSKIQGALLPWHSSFPSFGKLSEYMDFLNTRHFTNSAWNY